MLLAFGQCFSKVLFVYTEFCDHENGTLNFGRRLFDYAYTSNPSLSKNPGYAYCGLTACGHDLDDNRHRLTKSARKEAQLRPSAALTTRQCIDRIRRRHCAEPCAPQ